MQPPAPSAAPTPASRNPAARIAGETGRGFRLLWLGAVLVPLVLFAAAALWSRHAVEKEAWARLDRTVDMLHEHALRSFETQGAILEAVDQRVAGMPTAAIRSSREVHEFLAALARRAVPTGGMIVVGPDARILAASYQFEPAPVDLSDRDYMRAQAGGHDGTYVGEVIVTRPQNATVFSVSRRLSSTDGSFRGVVVSSFRPNYFEDFYRSVAETPGDVLTLVRDDGALLARSPPPSPETGYRSPPDSALLARAREGGRAGMRTRSPVDGGERLYVFRRVGDLPVYVTYGLSAGAVRGAWLRQLLGYGVVCGLASLMLLGLTAQAARSVRREREALASAQDQAERRADAEMRLRHAQRVDALGQIVGGVAHDFNNVVMAVMAGTRTIGKRADDPEQVRRIAGLIDGAAERGARLTARMLAFARRDEGQTDIVDVGQALDAVAELLENTLGSGYAVRLERPEKLPVARGDRAEFETVLVNLVLNARDAMPGGGTVAIRAAEEIVAEAGLAPGLQPGSYVRIAVEDHGTGMDPETLARVGEAFFTTKEPGRGTGLGLAMAKGFAERAGGSMKIQSELGHGTTVALWMATALG